MHLALAFRCLGLLLALIAPLAPDVAIGAEGPRQVLILHSGDHRLPSTNTVASAVAERLSASTSPAVSISTDFLDLLPRRDDGYVESLASFLAGKHSSQKIDVVVALDRRHSTSS